MHGLLPSNECISLNCLGILTTEIVKTERILCKQAGSDLSLDSAFMFPFWVSKVELALNNTCT